MDGVHVDGDSRGSLIVAGVHQAGRHFSKPSLSRLADAVIARQNFILFVLLSHHDRGEKAIAGDGFTQGGRLLFAEILRVSPQGDEIRQRNCDVTDCR